MSLMGLNTRPLTKILLSIFIVAIVLFSLWITGLYWLSQTLAQRRPEIQKMIDTQLGYPSKIGGMQIHTNIDGIYLALNNVEIQDSKTSTPMIAINQLELYPSLFQSLLQKRLIIRDIELDGLKMRFARDPNTEKFQLTGLKGETLDNDFDYKKNLGAITLYHGLYLKEAEIEWQGKSTKVVQRLSGEFSWISEPNKSFQFSGNQALQVNEGGFFKTTPLIFSFDPATEASHFQSGLANAAIDCRYDPKQGLVCDVSADQLDFASLHHNLILKQDDPAWLKWIVSALTKGYAEGYFKIAGPLDNLDWQGELRYRKLDLRYSPKWPAIENSAGTIQVDKSAVKVEMNRGDIVDTPIEKVTATIAPLGAETPATVIVEGKLLGDLENGMEFLKQSPLEKVYKTLALLNPKGGMDLTLNLKIPLTNLPTEVQGALKVKQGHVMLSELNLPIEQINGTFDFTEKGVTTPTPVKAEFLKQPLSITASPEGIQAETFVTMEFLQKQFSAPLLNELKGGANVVLQLPSDSSQWILKSDMKGVGVELPPPFQKKPEESLNLTLQVDKTGPHQTQFALQIPKVMAANWKMQGEKKKSTLEKGHIVLGEGASHLPNQNVLLITGNMDTLDVKLWQTFLEQKTELSHTAVPVMLNISTQKLLAFGTEFTQTAIQFNSESPDTWVLEGPLLKGSIQLPSIQRETLLLDLEYLNISNIDTQQSLAYKFLNTDKKIPIAFGCKALNYGSNKLGQVDFRLEPEPTGYAIQDFTAKSEDFALEASGSWKMGEKQQATFLKGQLYSDNVGTTFNRLGFSSISDGNGRIRFDFQWNDTPFDFALKKVQGTAFLQIKKGVILGVDPGLGKVVGLLSLDSISRRLQFDFRDVVKKGFAFDTMNASLKFQRGVASTTDFMIDGPSAKIGLAGQVNLANKNLNLNMRVTPKLVSSSLPIAASIATGNPAVGVGIWMFDKLAGSPLSNVAQYDYQVTGTWDSPNIQEVRKLGPKPRHMPKR